MPPRTRKDSIPRGIDYLANQRFELAFAINKVGEALQVRKDLPGAISKFREALELAGMIENTTRMEWKLQSATTRIKIARALKDSGDFDGAIQNYTDAIGREEALFAAYPVDKILRSNLASAYENRASLFQERKNYEAVFIGFTSSARLYGQLNEEDPRDITWLENSARVHMKYGAALEEHARSNNQPADKVVEHYGREVAIREKLAQRRPDDTVMQNRLRQSQQRLQSAQSSIAASKTSAPEGRP